MFYLSVHFSFIMHKKKYRNNLDNQQRLRSPKRSGPTVLDENDVKSNQDDIKYSNRMDIYSDGNENAIKINDEPTSELDDRPPRLPPRPPPRPRNATNSDAGKMIYSCRFFFFQVLFSCSLLTKWCPINWAKLKKFCVIFSRAFFCCLCFFLYFVKWENIWIEKVFFFACFWSWHDRKKLWIVKSTMSLFRELSVGVFFFSLWWVLSTVEWNHRIVYENDESFSWRTHSEESFCCLIENILGEYFANTKCFESHSAIKLNDIKPSLTSSSQLSVCAMENSPKAPLFILSHAV